MFNFSWNEWFVILTTFISIVLFLPFSRRFPLVVTILIWVYTVIFIETLDYIMGARPFNLYDFLDSSKYEPILVFYHFVVYPICSYIFLYFYDTYQLRGWKLAQYLAVWTGISVFYEWLCLINGVLAYRDWNLLYSIPTYPLASLLLIGVFRFIKSNLPPEIKSQMVIKNQMK
jgi:hypothetical protein